MAFEVEQSEEEASVQGQPHELQLREIDRLLDRFLAGLQPQHPVASDLRPDGGPVTTTDTGLVEGAEIAGVLAFPPQAPRILVANAARHRCPPVPVHSFQEFLHRPEEQDCPMMREGIRMKEPIP